LKEFIDKQNGYQSKKVHRIQDIGKRSNSECSFKP